MSTDPSYTVFIRLPFPRGDFVDPPSVEWDASKDKALWKILSKASKNSDIDWSELATRFEVTLAFLLQQAAWLYERQLSQVRAQMRKVGVSKGSATPSPVPWSASESAGGEGMKRTGSGGGQSATKHTRQNLHPPGRAPSALSNRRDSVIPTTEPLIPSRALASPFSRTPSATTTITSRNLPSQTQTSPRPPHATLRRSLSPIAQAPPSSPPLSSSDSSSSDSPPAHSRLLRRPRYTKKASTHPNLESVEDDEEDDDEPAFMPIAHQDPSATLRGDPRNITRKMPTQKRNITVQKSQTSDSSASSTPATPATNVRRQEVRRGERPMGPLSPKRTAELAGKSSDGTPSMGSSFSDLDDASVTQSALEEAMASKMQAGGGMASRMSSISHALRSKYL